MISFVLCFVVFMGVCIRTHIEIRTATSTTRRFLSNFEFGEISLSAQRVNPRMYACIRRQIEFFLVNNNHRYDHDAPLPFEL